MTSRRGANKPEKLEIGTAAVPSIGLHAGTVAHLGKRAVRVLSKAELAKFQATHLICRQLTVPLLLPDNRTGSCAQCGDAIQWRPDAPAGIRMCIDCGEVMMLSHEQRLRSTRS